MTWTRSTLAEYMGDCVLYRRLEPTCEGQRGLGDLWADRGPLLRRSSIATRLFWMSAGWLVVALVATGILLTELYSRALDTSLSETLEFHVETLVDRTLTAEDAASPGVRVADQPQQVAEIAASLLRHS